MIDRNFVMALAAAMLLIVCYNVYYEWRYGDYLRHQMEEQAQQEKAQAQNAKQPSAAAPEKAVEQQKPADASQQTASVEQTGEQTTTAASPGESPDATVAEAESVPERLIRIRTELAEIVISTKGAVLKHYFLDKYKGSDGERVDLVFDKSQFSKKVTESDKKIKTYAPLSLKFPRESFSDKVNGSNFSTSESSDDIALARTSGPKTIAFEFEDSSGVVIRKKYTFYPDSYQFDFSMQVRSNPKWGAFDYSLVWYGLGDEKSDQSSVGLSYTGPIAMVNGKRDASPPKDDEPRRTLKGDITWAALTNRYYTAAGIPGETEKRAVTEKYIDEKVFSLEWAQKATIGDKWEDYKFYVGPKEHNILKKYDNGMYSIIDYGWFDIIAKPLFSVMSFFHKVLGNWGWSIIALTVLVKALFFPLSQKGFKSMQKLQKLQPHLKKLQETYKDDKEKLNQELMNFYREHKVNPLGGCLPMFLQIPIFFSLYKTLLESIELKGAGWILWIKDLSLHDPYYVTPVLMGFSMLAQQLLTPKTGDPTQRKVMMALPFVFTFMFLKFPSGLVVYWLVNNILTIGQQWIIYREAK